MELVLFHAVAELVETHVDGFGSILSDGGADNTIGCAVIGWNGGGRLWMTKFCKWCSHWYGKLGIHVECSDWPQRLRT